ncbi:substrate-binding domain-containing protein [Paenibacillus sp. MSJ-34]|uniref:GntR family transcriptional regulator n=1 Tax=Paenibacillus sp. MSJ-34 TaxID=2841529 RepID=UPI001C0FB00E|nr:GntR family transcriptional regulator [Paenibacillus sp. MSJ-34]MBU5444514.1 GntR family transcriptional regulator [Paenibacillus sp. MSJ-34]
MANDYASKPMYEKIFAELRDKITSNQYEAGQRVPSEKELGEQYNVSRITSKKALELLASEGYIVRKPGRGSFVAEAPYSRIHSAGASPSGNRKPRSASDKSLIGLIITDFAESYGTDLIYGMEEMSRASDSYLVIRRTLGIPSLEEEAVKGMLELGVNGLIIFPAQGEYFNAEILKLVIDKFPFVLIDRHLKGISAGSISTNNVAGASIGTKYLFELGHERIGFLTPPPADTTAIEERIEGFIQAHAEQGIAVDRQLWMEDITSTLPSAHTAENRAKDIEKIKEHLRKHPDITAFFATEYNIARLAVEAVKQLGLSIPEDISIICFDCPETNGKYELTHLKQNQLEMGRLAFQHVLSLRDGTAIPEKVLLDATLVVGGSTGPVKRAAT